MIESAAQLEGSPADGSPPRVRPHLVPATASGAATVKPASKTAGVIARPRLLEQLDRAGRVALVSGPAGAGKTSLLRSWLDQSGLASAAAWLPIGREERDPQRFWSSVLDALRRTDAGSRLLRDVSTAGEPDGCAIVERLLAATASLEDRLWLVIDDVDELRSTEALDQLELLLAHAGGDFRFALATRHDVSLGLHRIRLEGQLTELRAIDLRFTLDEAQTLFERAGVDVPKSALAVLVERTEGWAAGLRLAALSLAGHPEPDRFAAEFSGTERVVADYLLAEVLARQPDEVRRLLLSTSILDRISTPLADRLTGRLGSRRILQELEQANAFVVSLDASRSSFRYHGLFADLLRLELERTEPEIVPELHRTAAAWSEKQGYVIEAVRHAQAAEDWGLAVRILSDHWHDLVLDGKEAAGCELLTGFPNARVTSDPELAALVAAGESMRGSFEDAERHLALSEQGLASLDAERRQRLEVMLAVQRLTLARRRGDVPALLEHMERLIGPGSASETLVASEELRAVALITLGMARVWVQQPAEAEHHLEQALALARRIEQPYLEIAALGHLAMAASHRSAAEAAGRSREALELAERHGWRDEAVVAAAGTALATVHLWQAHLAEAERWLARGERALRASSEPTTEAALQLGRAMLEIARGRDREALTACRGGERLAELLVPGHPVHLESRGLLLHALVRFGETARFEDALADLGQAERESGPVCTALAAMRLEKNDPEAATAALRPFLGNPPAGGNPVWTVVALLLEAEARDALGDLGAAERALERALDRAEPDRLVWPFLLCSPSDLLERHSRYRSAHGALISEIQGLLAGSEPSSSPVGPEPLWEPLSESETRVLRYLPSNLSAQEIAGELLLSVHTVKTHIRHVYAKLGVHARADAVERARAAGLLAAAWRAR